MDFRSITGCRSFVFGLYLTPGNPPYNEDFENSGENGNFAKPVYNYFMDATYEVADKVELIHPARFLFNAGSTPKTWNTKMLGDEHFKVLNYDANSTSVFPNTDIKGGIAISYRDITKKLGQSLFSWD